MAEVLGRSIQPAYAFAERPSTGAWRRVPTPWAERTPLTAATMSSWLGGGVGRATAGAAAIPDANNIAVTAALTHHRPPCRY